MKQEKRIDTSLYAFFYQYHREDATKQSLFTFEISI